MTICCGCVLNLLVHTTHGNNVDPITPDFKVSCNISYFRHVYHVTFMWLRCTKHDIVISAPLEATSFNKFVEKYENHTKLFHKINIFLTSFTLVFNDYT